MFMWSNLSIILLYGFCTGSFAERTYVTQNYENKLSVFSDSAFIISVFTFKTSVYLELISV